MANNMTFEQVSTILTSVVQQATGQKVITPTNTHEFVTVAQTALKTGYDPIINAISQVLSRSIFSIRPYYRKFNGIEYNETEWGNMVRKLSIADKPISDDDRYKWPVGYAADQQPPNGDGKSVDQYVINKPNILQTNFYGANVWSDWYTVFRDQLDSAFRSPEEFGQFLGMVSQNMMDKLEQVRENIARSTVSNFIGGILDAGQDDRVVHLLSEYKTLTGQDALTAQTVYQPTNFKPFMQFVYSRIAAISEMMTERSLMFQTVVDGKPVMRHTPKADQRVYLYAGARYNAEMMALADIYHDNYLRETPTETVNFWQSIETPDSISVTPGYIDTTGAAKTGEAVEQAGIYGVIFDRDALGYATLQQWSEATPFNARGGYTNIWFHETQRCFNDHTEKGVVLLLD